MKTLSKIAALMVLLGGGILLGGCQNPSQPVNPANGVASKVTSTDLRTEAMQALYSNQRTPKGFYSEPSSSVSVSVYHLKTTDLPNATDTGRHDLCTNDVSEAYAWISQYMSGMTDFALLDSDETAVYSEMSFESYTSPKVERRIRVFKCSYADRSVYDWDKPGTALAKLNAADSDGKALEFLSEYLWYFSPNNNSGDAVLDDSLKRVNGQWVFHITEVYSQSNWSGGCDTAMVFSTNYQVDPSSGVLSVDRNLTDSFSWQHDSSGYQLCSG